MSDLYLLLSMLKQAEVELSIYIGDISSLSIAGPNFMEHKKSDFGKICLMNYAYHLA